MPFTLPNRLSKTDPDPAAPTCGHCGYCVRGIPEIICPECGSDLREVGIIPAGKRAFSSKTIKLILWTFVAPPLAALISAVLFVTVLPFGQTCKFNRDIELQSPSFSTTISIIAVQHPWQPRVMGIPPISPGLLDVWYTYKSLTNGVNFFQVNPGSGDFGNVKITEGYQSIQGANFSAKDLAKCFGPHGVNLSDPHVQDMFNAVYSTIIQTSRNIDTNKRIPLLDSTGNQIGVAKPISSWVVYDEPNPILIVVLALFWLTIWIYGFRRILR